MSLTLGSNTYLKTRVSIMGQRLFGTGALESLIELPLDQIGKRFRLTDILSRDLSARVKNRAVERALIHTLLLEMSILLRPLSGETRELIVFWARKFELFNLKALIRGKLNNMAREEIEDNLFDLPAFLSLHREALLQTESILELLRRIEAGPYSDIARQARRAYETRHESFALDATIDQRYHSGLSKRIANTPAEDRKPLEKLVGALLDQQNLVWLLRYRFSYNLSPTETYYLLAPSPGLLGRNLLMALVNMDDFDKVIENLPIPLARLVRQAHNPTDVERGMEYHTSSQARIILKYSQSAVARVLAYLILRETDLKRLFALIQGKVLELDQDLVRFSLGILKEPPFADAESA